MEQERPETVQTGLRLPREMYDRLKRSDLGVSAEIRRRLEHTFSEEVYDAKTRELAADVMWMADQIRRDTRIEWHAHRKAHEAFTAAVMNWLEGLKPKEHESPAVEALFGPDDPQTLGRSIARLLRRFKEDIQEIRRLHPDLEGKS
jgi:hypothetical protein